MHLPTQESLGETINLIGMALRKKSFSYKRFSKLHLKIQWWCLSCGHIFKPHLSWHAFSSYVPLLLYKQTVADQTTTISVMNAVTCVATVAFNKYTFSFSCL